MTSEERERLWFWFFDSAMQYYIAGRSAAAVGLNPVAGNLLHHSVEMSLKGALLKSGADLQDLQNLRHDLKKIWKQCKKHFKEDSLASYDKTIAELHRFEQIRYPDSILNRGMVVTIHVGRGEVPAQSWERPEPRYDLRVAQVSLQ